MSEKITFLEHEDVGAEIAYKLMRRLKFPNKEIDYVIALIKNHMRQMNYQEMMNPRSARRFAIRVTEQGKFLPSFLDDLFDLNRADVANSNNAEEYTAIINKFADTVHHSIRELLDPSLKPPKLTIGGQDLIDLGIPPSPKMGQIIRQLTEEVVENPKLNTKEQLLQRAKELKSGD